MFAMAESVKPGFLNLKLAEDYLADYLVKMQADEGRYGCGKPEQPKTIIVDSRRGECGKAAARRASALCDHR